MSGFNTNLPADLRDPNQEALVRVGSGVTTIGETRVMSPTQANSGLLLGLQCRCPMCSLMTSEPAVCANCGAYGHAICLGLQHFEYYTFCGPCMRYVTEQYAAIQDANQRIDWHLQASQQLQTWKDRARATIGASASIGLAVGGVAATVAGAAVAAAQGFVKGAQSAIADHPVLSPPQPHSSAEGVVTLRRPSSAGDLPVQISPLCPACDLGQHKAHTYKGSCRGFPRGVYFPVTGTRAAIAPAPNAASNVASSSVEQTPPEATVSL